MRYDDWGERAPRWTGHPQRDDVGRRGTGALPDGGVRTGGRCVVGVEKAIAAGKEFAGDRDVDVAAGQVGGQALALGLVDRVVVSLVPAVVGSGRPSFATGRLATPLSLDNPTTIVPGDRVTPLVTTSSPDGRT